MEAPCDFPGMGHVLHWDRGSSVTSYAWLLCIGDTMFTAHNFNALKTESGELFAS